MYRKPLFVLSLALCVLMSIDRAVCDPPAPLKIIIQIPQRCELRTGKPWPLQLANYPMDAITNTETHFDVLIENISQKPVYIFSEDNSEGCRTLSLEVTMPDGTTKILCNEQDNWISNDINTQRLLPGECQIREVYYATDAAYLAVTHAPKPSWHCWGTLPFEAASGPLTIRAIFDEELHAYAQARQRMGKDLPFWWGKVESKPVQVDLMNLLVGFPHGEKPTSAGSPRAAGR
jgi:hypothetical protein